MYRVYYENSQLSQEATYADNNLEGKFSHYYESGQTRSISIYKKGKKLGDTQYFHEDGRRMTKEEVKEMIDRLFN